MPLCVDRDLLQGMVSTFSKFGEQAKWMQLYATHLNSNVSLAIMHSLNGVSSPAHYQACCMTLNVVFCFLDT